MGYEGSHGKRLDVPEQAAPSRAAVEERRVAAWIGQSVIVRGAVVATGDLTIDGHVEGTIELGDHNLTIGNGAAVTADLVARTIIISGTVTGNVVGRDKVDLRATGSVKGDITAPRFIMADGAVLHGKVETGNKKTPAA